MNVTVGYLEHIYPISVDGCTYSVRIGGLGTTIHDAIKSYDNNFIQVNTGRHVYVYDLLDVPRLGVTSRIVSWTNNNTGEHIIKEVQNNHVVGQRVPLN